MHRRLLLVALVALPLLALHAAGPAHVRADCNIDGCPPGSMSMTDFLASQHVSLTNVVAVQVGTVAQPSDPFRTFGGLIASINHTSDLLATVQGLGAVSTDHISLVSVTTLIPSDPVHPGDPFLPPALQNALQRNAAALGSLQAALGGVNVIPPSPIIPSDPLSPVVTLYYVPGNPV